MQIEEHIQYYRIKGELIADPEKDIKGALIEGIEYQEGQVVNVITEKGTHYDEMILDSIKKKPEGLCLSDEEGVLHTLVMEVISSIEKVGKTEE